MNFKQRLKRKRGKSKKKKNKAKTNRKINPARQTDKHLKKHK